MKQTDQPAAMRRRFEEWRDMEWGKSLTPGGSYEMSLREAFEAGAKSSALTSTEIEELARKIAHAFITGLKLDGVESTQNAEAKVSSSVEKLLHEGLEGEP